MSNNDFGGYPASYRKPSKMRSMSSNNTRARLEAKLEPLTRVGPYDLRPPPKVRPLDIRDTPEWRNPIKPGVRVAVPDVDPHVGTVEGSPSWRARDRAKLAPKQIDLSPDEYRRVKTAASNGRWRSAFRTVYRAVRAATRNKDLRLELALRVLEELLGRFLTPEERETGRYKPHGWTFATWGTGAGLNMGLNGLSQEELDQINMVPPAGFQGLITSRTGRDPNNGPPYPYQASISGQAIQRHNTFLNYLGVWRRYEVVPGANRHQHIATWQRPHSGVASALIFDPVKDVGVRSGVGPAIAPGASVKPGATPPRNRVGGNRVTNADPPPAVVSKAKDRKFAIAFNNRTWYGGLVNATTEVVDLIDVFYKALGKKCKGANTPQAKVMCLFNNWDSLNWEKVLRGLVANQIEDYIYGRIGSLSANAARKVGSSKGFQLGPWDTEFSYNTRDYDNNPIDLFVKFTTGT